MTKKQTIMNYTGLQCINYTAVFAANKRYDKPSIVSRVENSFIFQILNLNKFVAAS